MPRYDAAFLETPNQEGPFGYRGINEHGVIGMSAALANALSAATGCEMDELPLTFEKVWQLAGKGEKRDTLSRYLPSPGHALGGGGRLQRL